LNTLSRDSFASTLHPASASLFSRFQRGRLVAGRKSASVPSTLDSLPVLAFSFRFPSCEFGFGCSWSHLVLGPIPFDTLLEAVAFLILDAAVLFGPPLLAIDIAQHLMHSRRVWLASYVNQRQVCVYVCVCVCV
jgi:hypothetical protein